MSSLIIPPECKKWTLLHRTVGDYADTVMSDFRNIEPHLPERVDSIIDIGCGMAGIDVFLKQKYPAATLTLLDSDGQTANVGLSPDAGAGGNREAAEALLAANGVKPDKWMDIGTKEPLIADLIISLLSWGFHYPLTAYTAIGLCIADIRHGQRIPGTVIFKGQKSDRAIWNS